MVSFVLAGAVPTSCAAATTLGFFFGECSFLEFAGANPAAQINTSASQPQKAEFYLRAQILMGLFSSNCRLPLFLMRRLLLGLSAVNYCALVCALALCSLSLSSSHGGVCAAAALRTASGAFAPHCFIPPQMDATPRPQSLLRHNNSLICSFCSFSYGIFHLGN
jgi:hypothetical protein